MTDASQNLSEPGLMANAHGASILVRALHGGAQGNLQLKTIVKTLQRLPPAHARAIPEIVLGDTVGRGRVSQGGNTVAQGNRVVRIELTYWCLVHRLTIQGWCSTLLHETGHVATHAFGAGNLVTDRDLARISYTGVNRDTRYERFAVAYQRYIENPISFARGEQVAARAIEREFRRLQTRHGSDQIPLGWQWQFP